LRLDLAGERLTVTGTDLELTIQVEVAAAGETDGSTVIPARLAADIVRALEPGAVVVETADDNVHIAAGRSQFAVRPFAVDDYPRLATSTAEPMTISAASFGEALRQVARAASTDESRPILTGVLLSAEEGGLRLIATDSYRLAQRDLPDVDILPAGRSVIVPSRALNELQRAVGTTGEVVVRLGERDAVFEAASVRITTRLIEGEFPNTRQLIPHDYSNRVTVGRETLLDALRRVKLLARNPTPIRLALSGDGIDVSAVTQDVGQASEKLDAKYEGSEMTVAFNPDYLSAGVDALSGDEVVLETMDALKPAVLRSTEGGDFLYLLMPVRVP
jgi:DNA polymerase-3 subunit beta